MAGITVATEPNQEPLSLQEVKDYLRVENNSDERVLQSMIETEAQVLYAKLELIGKDTQTIKANAEFKLEQNDILQKHYLEALKPLLSSDEEKTEEVESDKPKKKNN